MFEGFQEHTIRLGKGIEIHARVGGSGPPVLLLHGYPQTHVCWHKVAPALASRFTVVAADLSRLVMQRSPAGSLRRGFELVQADQHLTTLAGLTDHAFELRDPPRGFTW